MSHDMKKPTKWVCAQWRLRSAWASAQSDQSLRCVFNGQLRTQVSSCWQRRLTGRMPRLIWVFAGAHSVCWFCHVAAHILQGEHKELCIYEEIGILSLNYHQTSTSLFLCQIIRNMTKLTKWVCAQWGLSIRPVWSESLLCIQWTAKDPRFLRSDPQAEMSLHWAHTQFVGFVMSRLVSIWTRQQHTASDTLNAAKPTKRLYAKRLSTWSHSSPGILWAAKDLCRQPRLIKLCGCAGWSESLL